MEKKPSGFSEGFGARWNILKIKPFLKTVRFSRKFLVVALAGIFGLGVFLYATPFVWYQQPDFLTFNELKKFSKNPHPGFFLESKLKRFWTKPIISNQAYYRGTKPHRPVDKKLGPYLRVVSWNIEKSVLMEDAITAFTSAEKFPSLINPDKVSPGSGRYKKIIQQRDRLSNADIIVLQEMDIGVKRSGYANAAKDLAKALKMNYTFAPEQLEIDPVYLGLEKIHYDDGTVDQEQTDYYAADPRKYKGIFGCAVLSRYPIRRVQAFQLKNQAYDWYAGEKPKIGFVEKTRRVGAKILFKNQLTREMKLGGRIYFRTDLAVPGLPENTLTVINIHLEIKCKPDGRERQMVEILHYIRKIKHPVIMIGDFNSAPEDLSPTSAWRVTTRTAQNPETWVSVGTSVLLPQALLINAGRITSKYTKNFNDPLAPDIKIIARNPVKPMFQMIEGYTFADKSSFDFRGDKNRSMNGKDGPLANSNERSHKAFKTSWRVKRPISIIGRYRLDWVFVKSNYLKNPYDKNAPYRFAPHFGETLEEMNTSLKEHISDHHPNVVDIPFQEPKI
ncbi:MAG: endonuclease/exonuclease/phosphatase family protein [Candidatus Omnitrophica bacterium]|nr:endonuclease/exonuclease/phosphatase family protein [Candidatus Omnitrophota bacterium]